MKTASVDILLLLILILGYSCESEDCHNTIAVKNNSSDSVVIALLIVSDGNCQLNGPIYPPHSIYNFIIRQCWEDELAQGRQEEIYIINKNFYNPPLVFYDCDSIEIKNKILKHFIVTLDYLKSNDFTLTYP